LLLAGANRGDLLYCVASGPGVGAEGKRSYANNVHTRIMLVGWPARRLADMSFRIYGQQGDPVIALL
jgi:hypothetical protein